MFEQIATSSKIKRRLVSAFVLAPAVVWVIWKGSLVFNIFLACVAAFSLFEWITLSLKTQKRAFFLFVGFFYISLAYLCCFAIRQLHGFEIATLFVTMVWLSDIGAFLVGKSIGGPKIAQTISPNKTWAGFLGSMLGPFLVLLLYFLFVTEDLGFEKLFASALIGILMGIVCQAGDLIESILKRQAGQKDSGGLIPGHGGLLDRVDSLMLAAPVFLFLATKLNMIF